MGDARTPLPPILAGSATEHAVSRTIELSFRASFGGHIVVVTRNRESFRGRLVRWSSALTKEILMDATPEVAETARSHAEQSRRLAEEAREVRDHHRG